MVQCSSVTGGIGVDNASPYQFVSHHCISCWKSILKLILFQKKGNISSIVLMCKLFSSPHFLLAAAYIFAIRRIHSSKEFQRSLWKFWFRRSARDNWTDHFYGMLCSRIFISIIVLLSFPEMCWYKLCPSNIIFLKWIEPQLSFKHSSHRYLTDTHTLFSWQHTIIPVQHVLSFCLNLVSRAFEFQVHSSCLKFSALPALKHLVALT